MSRETIEALTRDFAERRQQLIGRVQALKSELDRVRMGHVNGIRAAVREQADAHDRLRSAIEAEPELFVRPKTLTLHGVRVGWMKQRGQVVIEDESAVIDRIRRVLPSAQAELLIRRRESVDKQGVYDLTAADLKRLGITVTADEDVVVVKPVDGDVDKLVKALMSLAEQAVEDAA